MLASTVIQQKAKQVQFLQAGVRTFTSANSAPQGLPAIPNVSHLKRFYKHASVVRHPDSDKLTKLAAADEVTFDNLSLSHDGYWAVSLDKRIIKTMYKDPMPIPSRALAVALAEEWESQKERIDMKTLHLNQMFARAIRATHDTSLATHMQTDIMKILENDQICYREDPENENSYKRKLAEVQKEHTDPVHEFLKKRFDITLKIWHTIYMDPQDKSVKNAEPLLDQMDPICLNSLYQMTQVSKSAALALTLLYQEGDERLSLEDAVNVARVDEHFQQSKFGFIEGSHDYDKINTLTTFATARSMVQLAMLRDF